MIKMKVLELLKTLYETEKDLNALRSKVFQIKDEMQKIESAIELQIQTQFANQRTNKEFRDAKKFSLLQQHEEYIQLKTKHHSLLKQIDDLEAYRRYLERLYNLIANNIIPKEVIEDVEL